MGIDDNDDKDDKDNVSEVADILPDSKNRRLGVGRHGLDNKKSFNDIVDRINGLGDDAGGWADKPADALDLVVASLGGFLGGFVGSLFSRSFGRLLGGVIGRLVGRFYGGVGFLDGLCNRFSVCGSVGRIVRGDRDGRVVKVGEDNQRTGRGDFKRLDRTIVDKA